MFVSENPVSVYAVLQACERFAVTTFFSLESCACVHVCARCTNPGQGAAVIPSDQTVQIPATDNVHYLLIVLSVRNDALATKYTHTHTHTNPVTHFVL